jgi:hypothetical protein
MSEEISFQDADGKLVSGRFNVSDGMITVTAHDVRTRTVEIDESVLSSETLQKCSSFKCIRRGDGPVDAVPKHAELRQVPQRGESPAATDRNTIPGTAARSRRYTKPTDVTTGRVPHIGTRTNQNLATGWRAPRPRGPRADCT